MLLHQTDTETVINHAISLNRSLRFEIHGNTNLRQIPFNIAVVVADICGDVINRLWQNFVIIPVWVKAPVRIHIIFEIKFWGEIIEGVGGLPCFYTPGDIIIDAKKIDMR